MPPKKRQMQSTSRIEIPHASFSVPGESHIATTNDASSPPKPDGEFKEEKMRVRDVWKLPVGEKVLIPFDGSQPSGTEAVGLLGGYLGQLGSDHNLFPISFECLPKVLLSMKDVVWKDQIKARLWWEPIHDNVAQSYIMKDIGKKWKENRLRLYNSHYDPTKSRDENISNPPKSIPTTKWASFIDYRLKPKTQELCEKNARNRSKLTINHTGGSKKLKRKAAEIMRQTGQPVSRGALYIHTHKKSDGTYINDEARAICEKISEIESEGTTPISPSPNDSLGQVFGKEHPGRVRGVGSGVCPSQLFGSSQRYNACNSSTTVVADPQMQKEIDDLKQQLKLETQKRMSMEEKLNNICKKLDLPTSSEPMGDSNDSPVEQVAPVQLSTSQSGTHL
ncbi:putative transposase, Ptta/En/Spm, plant [Sesbania bispinosa]|nr:putative transposase, Ptta/En/Spm, plant [Sesbania bispinosa]